MRIRRTPALALAISVATTLLAGCGAAETSSSTRSAPESVTVSTVGQYLTAFTPLWAAAAELEEVERKYGTEIEYSSFGKGSDALTATLGGSAQICVCAFSTSLRAAAQDQSLIYGVNLFFGPGTVLVAATKFRDERGTDLARFDGATYGFTYEGGTDEMSLAAAVGHAGLKWEDQKRVAVGSVSAYVPALESGRVDLVMMDAGSAAKAIRDGVGYAILNTNDYETFQPIGGAVPGVGLVFPAKFRAEYPEFSQDVVTAVVAGLNKVRAQSDADVVYGLLSQGFRDVHPDRQAFESEWSLVHPSFEATDGTIGPETLRDATARLLGAAQEPAAADFVDNGLVEKSYETLGITRPSVLTSS